MGPPWRRTERRNTSCSSNPVLRLVGYQRSPYDRRVTWFGMQPCRLLGWLLVLWFASEGALYAAGTKPILLRNELINTPDRGVSLRTRESAPPESPADGLYLVQCVDHPQPAWRTELARHGVQLLRFVPEDAFVARLVHASVQEVRALPFVRWVGGYRPEWRVHQALHPFLHSKGETNNIPVRVLLSAGSAPDTIRQSGALLVGLESKTAFGTVVRAQVTGPQLRTLSGADDVLWVEPAPRMKLSDEIASKIVAGGEIPPPPNTNPSSGGKDQGPGSGDPNNKPNIARSEAFGVPHATVTQELGFDGSGVLVAVVDSGLNNGDAASMHPDLMGRVDGFLFYGSLTDASDGHGHGTHVAGIIAGDGATGETDDAGTLYGLGVAPRAHILVQRVFDAMGADQLPPYETLTHDAVRAGAVIGCNSWGDDVQGRYDLSAAQFDALVRDADADTPGEQPLILEFSAGNAGPGRQTLDSPAVAKNVIATGASENDRLDFTVYAEGDNAMADFSSRGPCEDGRIKPDLVAPGTWVASLASASASDENAWSSISAYYQYQGGTSQAGPHVAGAAAVFVQVPSVQA